MKVGIIGIATEHTPMTTRPSNVTTLTFGDEAEAVDRWVPRLRAAGADFVIVTAHSGAFCDRADPAKDCRGEIVDVATRLKHRPDLIVSGHTHSQVNTVVNGIRIVQASSNGTRFSVVDLARISPDSVVAQVQMQPVTYADSVRADTVVGALVRRYEAEVGPKVKEVITTLPTPLTREGDEYALGNLIIDAQRAATGTQVAIMNNGGIRTELLAGPVRYEDLFRLQPFANTLVTMRLSGARLLQALENVVGQGAEARRARQRAARPLRRLGQPGHARRRGDAGGRHPDPAGRSVHRHRQRLHGGGRRWIRRAHRGHRGETHRDRGPRHADRLPAHATAAARRAGHGADHARAALTRAAARRTTRNGVAWDLAPRDSVSSIHGAETTSNRHLHPHWSSRVIPLRDDNPTKLVAFVTVGLIALNLAAWLFIQGAGAPEALNASMAVFGSVPCELTGACARQGLGWASILTSMFMHGG